MKMLTEELNRVCRKEKKYLYRETPILRAKREYNINERILCPRENAIADLRELS